MALTTVGQTALFEASISWHRVGWRSASPEDLRRRVAPELPRLLRAMVAGHENRPDDAAREYVQRKRGQEGASPLATHGWQMCLRASPVYAKMLL